MEEDAVMILCPQQSSQLGKNRLVKGRFGTNHPAGSLSPRPCSLPGLLPTAWPWVAWPPPAERRAAVAPASTTLPSVPGRGRCLAAQEPSFRELGWFACTILHQKRLEGRLHFPWRNKHGPEVGVQEPSDFLCFRVHSAWSRG